MRTNANMQTMLVVAAVAMLAGACSEASEIPEAVVLDQQPLELDPDDDAADDLTITVEYKDGDGDLGGGTVDVIDCRADGLVTVLELPQIASAEAVAEGVPIEGTLEILVNDIGRVDPASAVPAACADLGVTAAPSADSVTFCIVLTDTAGNRGAGACTAGTVLRN